MCDNDIKEELSNISKMLYVMNKLLCEMIVLMYPNDKYYLLSLLIENDLVDKDDRDIHRNPGKR